MQFRHMPKQSFRAFVLLVSRMLAYQSCRRRNPRGTREQAEVYAHRNSAAYTDMALDYLATIEAAREADAAPWN